MFYHHLKSRATPSSNRQHKAAIRITGAYFVVFPVALRGSKQLLAVEVGKFIIFFFKYRLLEINFFF